MYKGTYRIALRLEVVGDHLLWHQQHHGAVAAEHALGEVDEEFGSDHFYERACVRVVVVQMCLERSPRRQKT